MTTYVVPLAEPLPPGAFGRAIAETAEEIKGILLHLKKHPKDFHSKRGVLRMVEKRRKLLKYLKTKNEKRYNSIVKAMGLKK